MTTFLIILTIILTIILFLLVVFNPRIDKNEQTGKYILWYSHKGTRKFIEL